MAYYFLMCCLRQWTANWFCIFTILRQKAMFLLYGVLMSALHNSFVYSKRRTAFWNASLSVSVKPYIRYAILHPPFVRGGRGCQYLAFQTVYRPKFVCVMNCGEKVASFVKAQYVKRYKQRAVYRCQSVCVAEQHVTIDQSANQFYIIRRYLTEDRKNVKPVRGS